MANVRDEMLKFENGLTSGAKGRISAPSTYKCTLSDIDVNAKRSTSGKLTRNRVRKDVYSVEVSWDRLSWDDLVLLIAAGEAAAFQLTFADPKSKSGKTTKKMYRDANMTYELLNLYTDEEGYWTTTMTFIEY